MPGSILFTGVAMVVYFVVGIKYEQVFLAGTPTSVGKYVVFLLVHIFTASMVYVYCKDRKQTRLILLYVLGITLVATLFSVFVIPFDIVLVQITLSVLLMIYLLYQRLRSRIPNYLYCSVLKKTFPELDIMCIRAR